MDQMKQDSYDKSHGKNILANLEIKRKKEIRMTENGTKKL